MPTTSRPIRSIVAVLMTLAFPAIGGCLNLEELLIRVSPGTGDGSGGDNDGATDGDPDDGAGATVPRVTLTASNPTPQLNEQLRLFCNVVAGDATGAVFDFQPSFGRLMEDPVTGTASLIIDTSDIGSSFSFTCTATTTAGTSAPSPVLIVVPTS